MQQDLENKFSSLTFTLVMSSVSAVCNKDGVGFLQRHGLEENRIPHKAKLKPVG